ncbi:MAG: DUF664 domain-containing protein [Phycisphaerales bacterium]|nr:MAG: DUF664 domain-containing protein [Phycisphaerales bacterium]
MIIEPTKAYDYLILARDRLFEWVRPLSPAEYTREFPFGRRSIARTLTHILASEWYYVHRIGGHAVPEYAQWPIREEEAPVFAGLVKAWAEQAERTRAAIAAVRDWKAEIEYRVTDDDGRPMLVTATRGDVFTQLVLHKVHHRAQAMSTLRHLGIAAADLDFNALTFRRRRAHA